MNNDTNTINSPLKHIIMKKITVLISLLFCILAYSQSIATYDVEFESVWESVANNPTTGQSTIDLPGNAHWSDLVITTHKTAGTFLMMGAAASPGIESVAETGATITFQAEVNNSADANQFINAGGLGTAKGTITSNGLQVSEDFPLVSLASMIAPSPDWFIGINGLTLRSGNNSVNNGWKDTFTVDIFPYDAGTEDGNGYSLNNSATNPLGVILSRSNSTTFNSNKIGTLTFTYVGSTLNVDNIKSIKNLKLFPNPTRGKITISNIQNIELKTIEIYSVLGKLVKHLSVRQNPSKLDLNLTHFNKGIYLLKVLDKAGISHTQKLVIN